MKMLRQKFTRLNKGEKTFSLIIALMGLSWFLLYLIPFVFGYDGAPPVGRENSITIFISMSMLMILYALGYALVRKGRIRKELIFSAFFVFSIILIALPEIGSADVRNYVMAGRVISVHQENPYIFSTGHFIDPITEFNEKGFSYDLELVYGPLWAVMSAAVTFLGGNSFLFSVALFKILGCIALLVSGIFLKKLVEDKYKAIITYLILLNPMLLFEAVNNAHNDMLMMCFVIIAYYFLTKRKYSKSGFFLGLSILVKYTFIIFLPIWIIYIFQKEKQATKKIVIFLAWMLLTICFAYLPFWEGVETFNGIQKQAGFFHEPSMAPVHQITYRSMGYLDGASQYIVSKAVSVLMFMGIYLYLIRRTWKKHEIMKSMMYAVLAFLMLMVPTFTNWYAIWIVPFLYLIQSKRDVFFWLGFFISLNALVTYSFAMNSAGTAFVEIVGIGMLVYFGLQKYRKI